MTNKSILWINILRAICIIGVFWVHSANYFGITTPLGRYILPFYVNGFFFISGYLLFRKQLSEPLISQKFTEYAKGGGKVQVLNVIYRIMIPTVFFSVIEFIPSFMLRGREFGVGTFLYKTIGGCTYWFTAALAVAELLIGLMLLTRRKNVWYYFACCSVVALIGWLLCSCDISLFPNSPSLPWQ